MTIINLDMYQALAVGAFMLVIGQSLVNRISLLKKYCISAPVVGGIIFSLMHTILRSSNILEFKMDTTLQDIFMTAFFCSVGFLASFGTLKKGGIGVIKLLLLSIFMIVIQNVVGGLGSCFFGLDGRMGLAMGSISLVGGHGTAASLGGYLEHLGVCGATTAAIAAATYGLIAGCVIGGPIATSKIRRYRLKKLNTNHDVIKDSVPVEVPRDVNTGALDADKMLRAASYIVIAVGLGTLFSSLINRLLTMPAYIGAMLSAAFIRNWADARGKPLPMDEISSLGSVSLSLFLALAMIYLKLWELVALAIPMVVILLIQTVVMWFYASYIVFPVMGRDYDAATMASGFCGFGLGATPNAIANMQAVTRLYGPAPVAFMIVPLVGSLFADFFNAAIVTAFASLRLF